MHQCVQYRIHDFRRISPRDRSGLRRNLYPRYDHYSQEIHDYSYRAVKQPLTQKMIEAHIRGMMTLGGYTLDENNQARWLCLDAENEQEWQGVLSIAHELQDIEIPTYIEPSKRGEHLWLFFKPIADKDARQYGK
jgi:hypothetical protein